jgi:AcrR family transcriptional regulator
MGTLFAIRMTDTDIKPSRGPKPGHSKEKIAALAIRIADAEGLEAASIRRIAAKLGSGAASLYRYVANKQELFDLMADSVLGEDRMPRSSRHWRSDLRKAARLYRAMYLRHPWMLTVSGFRMLNGTNLLRWVEFTLSAIDGHGLDIDEMLVLSNTLFAFARGHAASEIGEREASARSGMSRVDWMEEHAESIRSIVESERFPYFNRIVKDAATPHREAMEESSFQEGLECLLDGFAVRLRGGHP